ncbi:MAG: hypothetical protein ACEQSL_01600 [Sediminibacterium sp.]
MSFDLFSQPALPFTGNQLADIGMRMAEDHANEKIENWSDKCFELLKQYLKINTEPFMVEYFRQWTANKLPQPPSLRAFGAIIRKASQKGLVKHCGYSKVSNHKAHATPASVWQAL